MSYAFVENQHLTDIANAIRAKTGSQDTMKVREMSGNIENIPTGPDLSVITATASDVDTGKIFINSSGQEVTGTSTYKSDYTALDTDVKGLVNGTATSFTIPDGVTAIRSQLFYGMTTLTSVDIPDTVTTINGSSFQGCTNLALTQLPSALTTIGQYSFSGCTGLTTLEFPVGVTEIGMYAFSSCTGLTTLTFKGTPSQISSSDVGEAFYGCINITTINVPWAEDAVAGAPWGATNATINYNYAGE